MSDPAPARNFDRTVEDLPAGNPHTLRRRIDIVDVEVVKPKGFRHPTRLGNDAANCVSPDGKPLMRYQRTDARIGLLLAKKLSIES